MRNIIQRSTVLVVLLCFPLLTLATEEIQSEETTSSTTSTTTTTTTSSSPNASTLDSIIAADPKLNVTKDLFASETADPKKVDIVKQIRRLNEDGSYTVGYEAGDGTFKIESRDVQGNIKGTFGYVDEDGEIKRVSYSSVGNTSQPPPPVPFFQSTRLNRTTSTTTRRPQPTIIYPKSGNNPTRPTVIQSIPRRRISTTTTTTTPISIISTDSYSSVTANNVVSVNTSEVPVTPDIIKTVSRFPVFARNPEVNKPVYIPQANTPMNEPKIYKPLTQTKPAGEISDTASTTVKPVGIFERTTEKQRERIIRPNTFRRQLNPNNPFEGDQMTHFRQTAGEDTTDVYGGTLVYGTARPLFTTTTIRPRVLPIHSILRQKNQEKILTTVPPVHEDQQESTLEATTNKINDESYVTSNPIPVVQIPVTTPEIVDQRVIERPYLRRNPAAVQFRTREFLRDNPGAPIPIGNQRLVFRYNPNIQMDESEQYVRPIIPTPVPVANLVPVQNTGEEGKPNIIAIPLNNLPQQRYQIYSYPQDRPQPILSQRVPQPPPPPPQPILDLNNEIQTPVSTRDLKKLLQLLLIRQNRLQTLMDIRDEINPVPYAPQSSYEPEFRPKSTYGPRSVYPSQYNEQRYNEYTRQIAYPYQPTYEGGQYTRPDYRAQDDGYRNDINNFNPAVPYESQRYVPRRRYFRPRTYDQRYDVTPENTESEDYLPPDVREALLLKMLMLAINPDFAPPPTQTMMITTPVPEFRKKVRNVQILGEVPEAKDDGETKERRKSRVV